MSVVMGEAGESLVMAELLARGFDAFKAIRANPAFDISCVAKETRRATRLRVKTTSDGPAIWSAKRNGTIFLDFKEEATDDFVVICHVQDRVIREASIYVVPTPVVEQDLRQDSAFYLRFPRKDGRPRDPDSTTRVMRFFGEPKPDNQAFGYQLKYAQYRVAWDLLK
jgi:hypothetical protein